MNSEEKKDLLNKINSEIEQPETDMDTAAIQEMMNEYLDGQSIQCSKRESKKTADRIIANYSKAEPAHKKYKNRSVLVPIIVVLLIVSFIITAVAQKASIMNGVIWLGEKLNIITPSSVSPEDAEQPAEMVMELFVSGNYYLPRSISSDYVIKNYYEKRRTEECMDIGVEFVKNDSFINIIISNYESSESANIESPTVGMQPETELTINDLTIYIFKVDKTYTVYYSADNVVYQITTDMPYEDLCSMLNSISK